MTKKARMTFGDIVSYYIACFIWRIINPETVANKFAAIAMIALTVPCIILENDATATVMISLIAVPMFFAKERWIY